MTDRVHRFLVADQAVRGQIVRLGSTWQALREHAEYPQPVRQLLGEAVSAAVLLASSLKFEGLLTLQIESAGAVRLMVVQCTHDFRLRGVARFDAARVTPRFEELVGEGRIIVTIEGEGTPRYQGIVAIEGGSLAASLTHYFAASEQLPTCVRLLANDQLTGGMLIQRVAQLGGMDLGAAERDAAAQTWELAQQRLAAMDPQQLLTGSIEDLLPGCLAPHDVRLLPGTAVRFECRCSPERVSGILRSLGEAEVRGVLAELGTVTVTCEFCQRPYGFDSIDIEQLFAAVLVPGSERVN